MKRLHKVVSKGLRTGFRCRCELSCNIFLHTASSVTRGGRSLVVPILHVMRGKKKMFTVYNPTTQLRRQCHTWFRSERRIGSRLVVTTRGRCTAFESDSGCL